MNLQRSYVCGDINHKLVSDFIFLSIDLSLVSFLECFNEYYFDLKIIV